MKLRARTLRTSIPPFTLYGWLLLLTIFWPVSVTATEQSTLRLSCLADRNSQTGLFLTDLYNRALNPLNIRVELVNGTPEEIITMLANKEVDGSCMRDRSFVDITGMTHLLPLENSSITLSHYAVRLKNEQPNTDSSQLVLGHLPALKRPSQLFANMGYKALKGYRSPKTMLDALRRGEIDLAAIPDGLYSEYRNHNDATDLIIDKVLFSHPAYAHLIDDHRNIIEPFSRRLAALAAQTESYKDLHSPPSPAVKESTDLVFSCTTKKDGATYQKFAALTARALKNMGYTLKMKYMPRVREQLELEYGRVDGSCAKSRYQVTHVNRNLTIIEIPLAHERIDIFSADPSRRIGKLADFEDSDRIAIVRGTGVVKSKLTDLEPQLLEVHDIDQGLNMLATDKLDYFIDFRYAVIEHLDRIALNNPVYTAGHLSDVSFYPALHNKHKALAADLTAELEKVMIKEELESLIIH